ncbi:MAG: hypothetical protein BWX80_03673 [Candidatus Hydrogenedentes bacterium ADurb.Bin101]|nr:MAG: hypothetical protein BWX80_03673 [Candidatus Hydrogenedentes bacterium ADurb.Bin101]
MGWVAMLSAMMLVIMRKTTLFTIPIAPTAKSPPYFMRLRFNRACTTLFAACIKKGETPMETIASTISGCMPRYFLRSGTTHRFPRKWNSTQTERRDMEITVAMAAPFTPMFQRRINNASSGTLMPALISMLYMAMRALPSARIMPFMEKPKWCMIEPRRMMFR